MIKEDANLSETLKVIRKEVKVLKESFAPIECEDDIYYNEEKSESYDKPKHSVNCCVYDLPEFKGVAMVDSSRLLNYMDAKKYLSELSKKQADLRFAIRCVVMAVEFSNNKGNYVWSDLSDMPRSKTKKFQIADTFDKAGNPYKIRRVVYSKDV